MKFCVLNTIFAVMVLVNTGRTYGQSSKTPSSRHAQIAKISPAELATMARDVEHPDRIDAVLQLGAAPGKLDSTVPLLAELTMDSGELVRTAAGLALHRIGPAGAPSLKVMMNSDDELTLMAASSALKELGGGVKPYLPKIKKWLRSNNAQDRKRGLYALQSAGTDALPLMDLIIDALHDNDFNVQVMACRVLEGLGTDAMPAEDDLLELLKTGNPSASSWAAIALGAMGPTDRTDVAKLLAQNLESPIHPVKQRNLIGIANMGPEASSIVDQVRELAHDRQKRLMPHAAYALWRITGKPQESLDVLRPLISDPSYSGDAIELVGQMESAAAPLAATLAEQLGSPEESIRELALIALGKIGPASKSQKSKIEKLLGDPDALIRYAARETIERIEVEPGKVAP